MALATHPLKGSCSTCPSVPLLWRRGSKLNPCEPAFLAVRRKSMSISLECRSCSRSFSSPRTKVKIIQISAFKDNQFDDSGGGRVNSSKSLKKAVTVSYLKHKSKESSAESSKVQNDAPAPHTVSVEATTRSLAIQNLFKSWLMLLRVPAQTQAGDKIVEESSLGEKSETTHALVNKNGEFLKAVWCYIWSLDTTIRIPFLVFTPLYLAVNLVYGIDVSKELTPLWILGPLFVAAYMKLFRASSGIYAFLFKQTVNAINNMQAYYLPVHNDIIHGKSKEAIRVHTVQHVAYIKNTNYKEATRRKIEDLQGWLVERYLDLIELVWPTYSRKLRFLKRTTLI